MFAYLLVYLQKRGIKRNSKGVHGLKGESEPCQEKKLRSIRGLHGALRRVKRGL